MLALTCAGSVGILPVRGGLTCLAAASDDAGYWQLAPTLADGLNAGSGGTAPVCGLVGAVLSAELLGAAVVVVVVVAALLFCSCLVLTIAITTATTAATATIDAAAITTTRRILACFARRSSCRSSLRLALARRCSLVGTAGMPPWS